MFHWTKLRFFKFEKIKKKKLNWDLPGFSISGLPWDNIAISKFFEPL